MGAISLTCFHWSRTDCTSRLPKVEMSSPARELLYIPLGLHCSRAALLALPSATRGLTAGSVKCAFLGLREKSLLSGFRVPTDRDCDLRGTFPIWRFEFFCREALKFKW